jgi:uncharacterized protein
MQMSLGLGMMAEPATVGWKRPWYKRQYHKLLGLKDTPHSIALGFACGIFLGFTPLFGLKTILAVLLAWMLRSNKISAIIGVALHDFILPFVPVLLRMQYLIGFWLASNPHQLPPEMSLKNIQLERVFHWTTFLTVGGPLMLGSLVTALPFGVVAYFLARWFVIEFRRKREIYRRKHPRRHEPDDTFD